PPAPAAASAGGPPAPPPDLPGTCDLNPQAGEEAVDVAPILARTPAPGGIQWSTADARTGDSVTHDVRLGLEGLDRVGAWSSLPAADQEPYLRQVVVDYAAVRHPPILP